MPCPSESDAGLPRNLVPPMPFVHATGSRAGGNRVNTAAAALACEGGGAALAAPPPGSAVEPKLMRRDAGADLASDAGTAEPAIAHRVLGEILLVIVLGKVELRRVEDLGRDGAVALRRQRLLVLGLRPLGGCTLRRRSDVDTRAILGPDVVALAHALG